MKWTMTQREVGIHLLEHWGERAAIREFDGGMSRDEAERAAWMDVLFPGEVGDDETFERDEKMTKEYDNTNSGVLFRNDRKQSGDNKPEYTGSLNVDGQEFWLSGWFREGKKGKFFSLSVTKKEDRAAPTKSNIDDYAPV